VRIHSRMLTFSPEKINSKILQLGRSFGPLYLVNHFNHPTELTPFVSFKAKQLQKNGFILLNQNVLLKGVNDHLPTLKRLYSRLVRHGILPYYLHTLDPVIGSRHFDVPLKKAHYLIRELQGS